MPDLPPSITLSRAALVDLLTTAATIAQHSQPGQTRGDVTALLGTYGLAAESPRLDALVRSAREVTGDLGNLGAAVDGGLCRPLVTAYARVPFPADAPLRGAAERQARRRAVGAVEVQLADHGAVVVGEVHTGVWEDTPGYRYVWARCLARLPVEQ